MKQESQDSAKQSDLPSVVDRFAAIAVSKVRQGGRLFGKTYVRQGPLHSVAGWWLFQTGGAFGYGLREHPAIIGKLLGVPGEDASTYVQTVLHDLASEQLTRASDKEKTFLQLYLVPTVAELGIDIYDLQSHSKDWISKKVYDLDLLFESMQIAFQKGAAIAFHFPDEFQAYWNETYGKRPAQEWTDAYKQGIVSQEEQQELELEAETIIALDAVVDWVKQTAPSQISVNELSVVRELAHNYK